MYNRYIRDNSGVYTRVPQEDADTFWGENKSSHDPPKIQDSCFGPENTAHSVKETAFLRRLLDQLHLEHIDSGDLLLLGLLFFLFREGADEELLVALGLLLIL